MSETCSICLDEITTSSLKFQCGHFFHKHCGDQFMRCNINYNNKCPLCRTNIEKVEIDNKSIELPNYDNESYVWIFGYFKDYEYFNNYDIVKGNLKSGCLWTIYDKKKNELFEKNFNEIYNKGGKLEFEIGSKSYYLDFSKNYLNDDIFGFVQDIKDDNLTKLRPIIRIKFGDMIKYKFTIGIGNNIFLDKFLIKKDTNEIINLIDQFKIFRDVDDIDYDINELTDYVLIDLKKLKTYDSLIII
jgi:hypothetical protein